MGKTEEPALGVDDLDVNAPATRFPHDDHRIGIEAVIGLATSKQVLVYLVLALDREERHALEAELLVKLDRAFIVMKHR